MSRGDGLDGKGAKGAAWSTCRVCGKRSFLTKADAKRTIRGLRGRQGRLSPYRSCDVDGWHIGHHSGGYSRQAFREAR